MLSCLFLKSFVLGCSVSVIVPISTLCEIEYLHQNVAVAKKMTDISITNSIAYICTFQIIYLFCPNTLKRTHHHADNKVQTSKLIKSVAETELTLNMHGASRGIYTSLHSYCY